MRAVAISLAVLGLAGPVLADSNGIDPTPYQPEAGEADIIGGTLAPAGKWPDTVAVLGNGGQCTGTLIAPDVVLTAGHCVGGMTTVIANATDYNAQGGTRSTIKSHTAYPNWETTYDVSVIVLNTPITGVTPRPVGVDDCTFADFGNKPNVQLVGFGLTDNAAQGNNTKLYEVSVPVTDPFCANTADGCKPAVQAAKGEFAAGGGNKDSCNGDSGGPVYLNTPRGWVVIGAVSRAYDTATEPCGGGGIYVRTNATVVQWIEQTTGKTIAKDCANAAPPDPSNPDPNNPNNPNNPSNPSDPNTSEPSADVTGGCSTGNTTGFGALVLLGFALLRRRRRRR
jgi:uncharacterized protein (TIGR03382 family)